MSCLITELIASSFVVLLSILISVLAVDFSLFCSSCIGKLCLLVNKFWRTFCRPAMKSKSYIVCTVDNIKTSLSYRIQIYRSTDIQKYRYTEVQIYRSTDIQKYRYTEVQIYRSTDIQKYRYTEVQIYRSTDIQKYRYTEVQIYRRTDIQKYDIQKYRYKIHYIVYRIHSIQNTHKYIVYRSTDIKYRSLSRPLNYYLAVLCYLL